MVLYTSGLIDRNGESVSKLVGLYMGYLYSGGGYIRWFTVSSQILQEPAIISFSQNVSLQVTRDKSPRLNTTSGYNICFNFELNTILTCAANLWLDIQKLFPSPCFAIQSFVSFYPYIGHRLNATVHIGLYAGHEIDCAIQCVHNTCCRSVNYRKSLRYDGEENCELLHAVVSEQRENLKEHELYDYLILNEPSRVSNHQTNFFYL